LSFEEALQRNQQFRKDWEQAIEKHNQVREEHARKSGIQTAEEEEKNPEIKGIRKQSNPQISQARGTEQIQNVEEVRRDPVKNRILQSNRETKNKKVSQDDVLEHQNLVEALNAGLRDVEELANSILF